MGKRSTPKPIVTEQQLEVAAPAPAPIATIGSNSGAVTAAFIKGRNIAKSMDDAAAELDLPQDQAAIQKERVRELKIGLIFAYLAKNVDGYADLTDTEAYERGKRALETEAKLRTAIEAAAENSARTEVSRLFTKYKLTNWNAKGGHNKMTDEERAAAKAKKDAERVADMKKTLAAEGWVAPDGQVQMAAFVIPAMETVTDYTDHIKLVRRGMVDALKKAENVISGADLTNFVRPKLKNIMDMLDEIAVHLATKKG